jgi:hypothetical protein
LEGFKKMSTPEEQAIAFKNEGNKAFAAHDWVLAIEKYTKATELNDKEPVFWSNRAQVSSKTFSSLVRVTNYNFHRQISNPRLMAMLSPMQRRQLN